MPRFDTTENTFDYENPLSQENLEEIAKSGSQRTALGKTVQILASLYGGEAGNQFAWNIFDVDQINVNINLVKSAFKQILPYRFLENLSNNYFSENLTIELKDSKSTLDILSHFISDSSTKDKDTLASSAKYPSHSFNLVS